MEPINFSAVLALHPKAKGHPEPRNVAMRDSEGRGCLRSMRCRHRGFAALAGALFVGNE